MKTRELIRIWIKYKNNEGIIQQAACNIYFSTVAEAKKCVKYLNLTEDSKYKYFYQKQTITEYETAEEYVKEHTVQDELTK